MLIHKHMEKRLIVIINAASHLGRKKIKTLILIWSNKTGQNSICNIAKGFVHGQSIIIRLISLSIISRLLCMWEWTQNRLRLTRWSRPRCQVGHRVPVSGSARMCGYGYWKRAPPSVTRPPTPPSPAEDLCHHIKTRYVTKDIDWLINLFECFFGMQH